MKEKYVVCLSTGEVFAGDVVKMEDSHVVLGNVIKVGYHEKSNSQAVNWTVNNPIENVTDKKIRFNRNFIVMEYYQSSDKF